MISHGLAWSFHDELIDGANFIHWNLYGPIASTSWYVGGDREGIKISTRLYIAARDGSPDLPLQ